MSIDMLPYELVMAIAERLTRRSRMDLLSISKRLYEISMMYYESRAGRYKEILEGDMVLYALPFGEFLSIVYFGHLNGRSTLYKFLVETRKRINVEPDGICINRLFVWKHEKMIMVLNGNIHFAIDNSKYAMLTNHDYVYFIKRRYAFDALFAIMKQEVFRYDYVYETASSLLIKIGGPLWSSWYIPKSPKEYVEFAQLCINDDIPYPKLLLHEVRIGTFEQRCIVAPKVSPIKEFLQYIKKKVRIL